jgi:hypothetical protein
MTAPSRAARSREEKAMPAEDNPVAAAPGASPHAVAKPRSHIQDFIFVRELCEVYLLLDHISGRWDKTFPEKNLDPARAHDSVTIESICRIGWPVVGNTVERAQQAATLLVAKDMLNAAARPANGATVAFTLMVVGEGNRHIGSLERKEKKQSDSTGAGLGAPGAENQPAEAPQPERPDTYWLGDHNGTPDRFYLAHKAYPGLVDAAATFRKRIGTLVGFLIGVLMLTSALSWYAATGNIILTHLDSTHLQEREISRKIGAMVTSSLADRLKQSSTLRDGTAVAEVSLRTAPADSILGDPVNSPEACRAYFGNVIDRSKSAEPFQLCDALEDKLNEHKAIGATLAGWVFWKRLWTAPHPESHGDEEFGRIVTQLLVTSVLPFFYGVLGAGAAIVRDLWSKTRESCLSPRDSTLALGQLALGAIVGGCISLFFSPTVAAGSGDSVLGSFILTSSALSFVAGFGVEGVFQALESLVRRIFNNPDPTKSK